MLPVHDISLPADTQVSCADTSAVSTGRRAESMSGRSGHGPWTSTLHKNPRPQGFKAVDATCAQF